MELMGAKWTQFMCVSEFLESGTSWKYFANQDAVSVVFYQGACGLIDSVFFLPNTIRYQLHVNVIASNVYFLWSSVLHTRQSLNSTRESDELKLMNIFSPTWIQSV